MHFDSIRSTTAGSDRITRDGDRTLRSLAFADVDYPTNSRKFHQMTISAAALYLHRGSIRQKALHR